MRENGDAVEGAVVFGVVQPALQAVGALSADADTQDVRGAAQTENAEHNDHTL